MRWKLPDFARHYLSYAREALRRSTQKTDVLDAFTSLDRSRVPAWLWVVLVWAVLVIPAISLRGIHYEEGTVIALARGAIEDGHWLAPYHYGVRWVERPALMSWLITGLAMAFGDINHWVARLPQVLSLLAGGALVFYFVRRQASALAALFAAACFFFSPALLQKLITAEPDVMVSVMLFAAFVVWWDGHAAGRVTLPRWLAVGLILGVAALAKGPQPLAYFTLGVGAFLLVRGRWADLPGFVLANLVAAAIVLAWYVAVHEPGDLALWQGHSRLGGQAFGPWIVDIFDFLVRLIPEFGAALLLAVPLVAITLRTRRWKADEIVIALTLYAVCTTLLLIFWPRAHTRYAMPAVLAVAALAGLGFDRFRAARPRLVNLSLVVVAWLAVYQLVIGWLAMPLFPDLFQKSRIAGRIMAAAIEAAPATLYGIHDTLNNNPFVYVRTPIRDVRLEELARVPTPAWAVLEPEEVARLRALRPDLPITLRAVLNVDTQMHLVELGRK